MYALNVSDAAWLLFIIAVARLIWYMASKKSGGDSIAKSSDSGKGQNVRNSPRTSHGHRSSTHTSPRDAENAPSILEAQRRDRIAKHTQRLRSPFRNSTRREQSSQEREISSIAEEREDADSDVVLVVKRKESKHRETRVVPEEEETQTRPQKSFSSLDFFRRRTEVVGSEEARRKASKASRPFTFVGLGPTTPVRHSPRISSPRGPQRRENISRYSSPPPGHPQIPSPPMSPLQSLEFPTSPSSPLSVNRESDNDEEERDIQIKSPRTTFPVVTAKKASRVPTKVTVVVEESEESSAKSTGKTSSAKTQILIATPTPSVPIIFESKEDNSEPEASSINLRKKQPALSSRRKRHTESSATTLKNFPSGNEDRDAESESRKQASARKEIRDTVSTARSSRTIRPLPSAIVVEEEEEEEEEEKVIVSVKSVKLEEDAKIVTVIREKYVLVSPDKRAPKGKHVHVKNRKSKDSSDIARPALIREEDAMRERDVGAYISASLAAGYVRVQIIDESKIPPPIRHDDSRQHYYSRTLELRRTIPKEALDTETTRYVRIVDVFGPSGKGPIRWTWFRGGKDSPEMKGLPENMTRSLLWEKLQNALREGAMLGNKLHFLYQKAVLPRWRLQSEICGIYAAILFDEGEEKYKIYIGRMTSITVRWNTSVLSTTGSHFPPIRNTLKHARNIQLFEDWDTGKTSLFEFASAASIALFYSNPSAFSYAGVWLFVLETYNDGRFLDDRERYWIRKFESENPRLGYNRA